MTAYDKKKCVHLAPRTRRARRENSSRAWRRGPALLCRDPRARSIERASGERTKISLTPQTAGNNVSLEILNPDTSSPRSFPSPSASRYVWKLLYIFMLGYRVDFGHMNVVGPISSPKYAEKQVGYTVTSVLLNETHDFLRLVINSVREDVIKCSETFQCLGLSLVANVGGREFADSLAADVQRVLCSNVIRPIVRKRRRWRCSPLSPPTETSSRRRRFPSACSTSWTSATSASSPVSSPYLPASSRTITGGTNRASPRFAR